MLNCEVSDRYNMVNITSTSGKENTFTLTGNKPVLILGKNRQKMLEERRQAQKLYNDSLKDVSTWLISTERRFNQFQPVAKDMETIKAQYDELKVVTVLVYVFT